MATPLQACTKILTGVLTGVIAGVFVFGAAAAAAHTITYLAYGGRQQMAFLNKFVVPHFEARYPDIKVKVINGGGEGKSGDKLLTMLAGGVIPDVAFIKHQYFPMFVRQGALTPLDSYIKASGFDVGNLPPAVVQGTLTYQGHIYGMPIDGFGFNEAAMYINRDRFTQAGLVLPAVGNYTDPASDWSYDDFRADARKLTIDKDGDGTPDVWGATFPLDVPVNVLPELWSFGGKLIDPETLAVQATSAQIETTLQYFHDMVFQDKSIGGNRKAFIGGTVAIFKGPFNTMAALDRTAFDWSLAPMPHGPDGRWAAATGNPLTIPKKAAHKDAAFKFISFYMSDEVQFQLAAQGFPPQTRSALTQPGFLHTNAPPYDKSPFFFGWSRSMPIWVPGWGDIEDAITQIDKAYFKGKGDVPLATMAANLQSRITSIIQQNR